MGEGAALVYCPCPMLPFRPDASRRSPPTAPGGGQISRGPPESASHASRRFPCLLVSYRPLATVLTTSSSALVLGGLRARCSGCEGLSTHLLRAQRPSHLAPRLELHPSCSSTSECAHLETPARSTPSQRRSNGSPHAPPLDDDRRQSSASTSTGTGDGGGEALLPFTRRGAVAQRARALFI